MIIRVARRRRFAVIDRSALNDPRLSFKAKGLLAFLLDKPEDWNIDRDALAEVGPDGVTAIRSALKELADAGYLRRQKARRENGQIVTESWLFESPPEAENPPAVGGSTAGGKTDGGKTDQRETSHLIQKTDTETPLISPNQFEAFWGRYPSRNGKKVEKSRAELQWSRLKDDDRQQALAGVEHYCSACDQQLAIAKDAHRWLRDRCWVDWQTPARPAIRKQGEPAVARLPVFDDAYRAHIESLPVVEPVAAEPVKRSPEEISRAQALREQLHQRERSA